MSEDNTTGTTDVTTPAAPEASRADTSAFEVTKEMRVLDEAVLLMTTHPRWFKSPAGRAVDPMLERIVSPLDGFNPEAYPAAVLYVLYGKPSIITEVPIAVGVQLVSEALQRMGATRFDIVASILLVLGDKKLLHEHTSLANARRLQVAKEPVVLTPADIHSLLMQVAMTVVDRKDIERLVVGLSLVGLAFGLTEHISKVSLDEALDISEAPAPVPGNTPAAAKETPPLI